MGGRVAGDRTALERPPQLRHCRGAAVSITQTGPRANVMGWPDMVVNVVPPLASGRDQRMAYAWQPRSTIPAATALLAATAELALRRLPPERLTSELVHELPARALLDRAARAEMLVLGTTRPNPQSGQPPGAMGPVARACLRGKCEADAELGYQLLKRVTAVMYQRLESARVRLLDLYGPEPARA